MKRVMDLSASSLFASLVVSSIGFSLFLYGKKQMRTPQLSVGLVMMTYPYFVSDPLMVCGSAGALLLGLVCAVRSGV